MELSNLLGMLENNGYGVVVGKEATLSAIKSVGDSKNLSLCSGYGVFPDGHKCGGCPDCKPDSKLKGV